MKRFHLCAMAAAAVLTRDQARELMALGLKDSKALSPRRREALFEAIRSLNVQWGPKRPPGAG